MTNFERWKELITPKYIAGIITQKPIPYKCEVCPLLTMNKECGCQVYTDLASHDDNCYLLLVTWFNQECLRKEAK